MKVKVVGIEARSGIGKKSGKPYDGYFLYYMHEQMGVMGMRTSDTFLDRAFADPKIKEIGSCEFLPGHEVDLDFDQRGFLQNFTIVLTAADKKSKEVPPFVKE